MSTHIAGVRAWFMVLCFRSRPTRAVPVLADDQVRQCGWLPGKRAGVLGEDVGGVGNHVAAHEEGAHALEGRPRPAAGLLFAGTLAVLD